MVFEDSINGLRAGRDSGAFVVALTTTNPYEAVAPLADLVIENFKGMTLDELWVKGYGITMASASSLPRLTIPS